ncbi:MAG: S-methyl-5-thioribose-1-phosphate isomerase [Candidatus Omnitrophica bacterium]|nr:S-methyl-5-thioribose-1-phosphate isomerase [Candidatus Omnitrophota bacterium]MDD5592990.1 S-methyl-5-thioribose-1-phosphate isomerase [Candidatus Omnitrophota bacterium]
MEIKTIEWKNNSVKIIDQTRLPLELRYLYIKDPRVLWQAIKELKVRGAPALGLAGALGVYLGIKNSKAKNFRELSKELDKVAKYIASCRPTARNLFWGIERIYSVAVKNRNQSIPAIKKLLFKETQKIMQEDRETCRSIGRYGAKLIRNKDTILTVCNAGILATIDYGTALGVIYKAKEEGKHLKVYACETRPLLQGARLTTWELKKKGIDVTLICDNMAAALMRQGKIDKVIAGADRIAANGDTANKIGTYSLAVLSHYHKIPFYIAAPRSTFDLKIKNGKDIPIEERNAREVTELFFKRPIAASGIKVFNPAFDVTPHGLITAIITDKGIIRPPYARNIKKIIGNLKNK